MPEITRFYGIVIHIYFAREHNPPHFHAIYSGKEGASIYQKELMTMWDTKTRQKLNPLD